MEFWKFYRLIKARRGMILGLMLVTLLVVVVAKKAVDEQTQYVADAVVLPSSQAYSPQGFFQDNGHGLMSATYSRYDRMALFTQSIKSQFDGAVALAGQPTLDQKREVVRALSNQLSPDQARLIGWKNFPDVKGASEATLNKVLTAFRAPTSDAVWRSRSYSDDDLKQMRETLISQPVISDVNTNPGGASPSPVITDYLHIGVRAPREVQSEQMANLIAASFINNYYDDGVKEYNSAINAVRRTQRTARDKVEKLNNALVDFEQKDPNVHLGRTVDTDVSNLTGLERSRDQAKLQMEVANKSIATYKALAAQTGPTTVVKLDSRAGAQYGRIQEQVIDAQAGLENLGKTLTPQNPKYQKAQYALSALIKERDTLASQPKVVASLNPQYTQLNSATVAAQAEAARAQQTIESLDTQIADQRAKNEQLPEKEKQLNALYEDLQTAEVAKKAADAAVDETVKDNKIINRGLINITNPASTATPDASGPGLVSLLIYGAVLSLIIGIAAAVGLDYLDNSVQTIPDAEKLLGMPVSAMIPAFPPGDPRRQARLVVSDPLSPIAESYRLLRTDLLFSAEEKPFQSLMAATAKPGQGATTTICNLAVALAAVGKRVILIDADLRRPKLHDYFSVSNETGLTSLLRDECELEEALKVTDIDNLLVLPSGPLPLNPAELLASHKMRALHERLKPHTDFILFDTPSAIAFSDAAILASYLDAVMIVLRAQETPRGSETQLKAMLGKARANVIGVVLNGVKPQLVDSYLYHSSYYPRVTTGNGHALGGDGNGALPHASNGNGVNGHAAHNRTLEGEDVATAVSGQPEGVGASRDVETTMVMDDIVTVTPNKPRGRFNVRKMFGTHDQDGE